MKECPNCHQQIKDSFAFCEYCGSPISPSKPKYIPGFEPENVKKHLAMFLSEIDRAFPDKRIVWSEWNHERWDNAANMLCKALGYKNGRAFFEAYGYIVVYAEASDSQENHMGNQASKDRRERTKKQICAERRALKSEPIKQLKGNVRFVVLGIIIVVLLLSGVLFISYIDSQSSKTSESPASYITKQSNDIIVENHAEGYYYDKMSESPVSYKTNQSNDIIVESNTEGYYYSITYEDFYAQMITAFSNATGIPENTISKQLQYAKPYSRNFEGYNNNVNLYRIKYDKDYVNAVHPSLTIETYTVPITDRIISVRVIGSDGLPADIFNIIANKVSSIICGKIISELNDYVVSIDETETVRTDYLIYGDHSLTFVQGKPIGFEFTTSRRLEIKPAQYSEYYSQNYSSTDQKSVAIAPAFTSTPTPTFAPTLTPTPTFMPSPTPTLVPAWIPTPSPVSITPTTAFVQVNLPRITKSPGDETVTENGWCQFVTRYENADVAEWHFVSPDGSLDADYKTVQSQFPSMNIIGGNTKDMTLENIPAALNGCRVYCRFSNSAGYVDTASALLTVIHLQNPTGTSQSSFQNSPARLSSDSFFRVGDIFMNDAGHTFEITDYVNDQYIFRISIIRARRLDAVGWIEGQRAYFSADPGNGINSGCFSFNGDDYTLEFIGATYPLNAGSAFYHFKKYQQGDAVTVNNPNGGIGHLMFDSLIPSDYTPFIGTWWDVHEGGMEGSRIELVIDKIYENRMSGTVTFGPGSFDWEAMLFEDGIVDSFIESRSDYMNTTGGFSFAMRTDQSGRLWIEFHGAVETSGIYDDIGPIVSDTGNAILTHVQID